MFRALGGGVYLMGGALSVLVWWWVPERALAVLARDDVFSVVWPLVPVLLAATVSAAVAFDSRDFERCAARSRIGFRLRSLSFLTLIAGATVALSPHDPAIGTRSLLVLLGIALVSVTVLPGTHAWVPVAFYPLACWLLGTRSGGLHAMWAVPLRPAEDAAAMRNAVALAIVGAVAFVLAGTRTGRRSGG